jgi:hypothetical protein
MKKDLVCTHTLKMPEELLDDMEGTPKVYRRQATCLTKSRIEETNTRKGATFPQSSGKIIILM